MRTFFESSVDSHPGFNQSNQNPTKSLVHYCGCMNPKFQPGASIESKDISKKVPGGKSHFWNKIVQKPEHLSSCTWCQKIALEKFYRFDQTHLPRNFGKVGKSHPKIIEVTIIIIFWTFACCGFCAGAKLGILTSLKF